jgi:RNA polymerase sigma factor (sigma-70 family)
LNFEEIYQQYNALVLNLALQYVQNLEDAEEITQDVFVKIYFKLNSFRQDAKLTTWIYRITINCSLDFIKARKRKKRFAELISFFSSQSDKKNLEIPDFQHPGIELEQKEALQQIFQFINELPDNQKTALILLKIEAKSQQETAEIMNLSVKAVESLFQRAKTTLLKKLKTGEGK